MIKEFIKNNDGVMFDINLMQYFYNEEYEKNDMVVSAWCTYVLKFLPLVNKQWRENVSSDKLRNKEFLYHSITVSDEALVRWFIELWVPIINSRKTIGWDVSEKSLGKGPHDTKKNIDRYSILHQDIDVKRKNYKTAIRWNDLFWNEIEQKHKNLFKQKEKRYYGDDTKNEMNIPLPDINDETDFLATYIHSNNLVPCTDNSSNDNGPDFVLSNDNLFYSQVREI